MEALCEKLRELGLSTPLSTNDLVQHLRDAAKDLEESELDEVAAQKFTQQVDGIVQALYAQCDEVKASVIKKRQNIDQRLDDARREVLEVNKQLANLPNHVKVMAREAVKNKRHSARRQDLQEAALADAKTMYRRSLGQIHCDRSRLMQTVETLQGDITRCNSEMARLKREITSFGDAFSASLLKILSLAKLQVDQHS